MIKILKIVFAILALWFIFNLIGTSKKDDVNKVIEEATGYRIPEFDLPGFNGSESEINIPEIKMPEVGSSGPEDSSAPSGEVVTEVSSDDINEALEKLNELDQRAEYETEDYPGYDSETDRFPWDNEGKSCWTVREQNLIDYAKDYELDSEECVIEMLTYDEPWGGEPYEYVRSRDGNTIALDTEHISSWHNLHASGAWKLDQDTQRDIYNDYDNLIPADPGINRSVHSDKLWGEWYPPNEGSHCMAATKIINIHHKWELSIVTDEANALAETLSDC